MNQDDLLKLDKNEIIEILLATFALVEEQAKEIAELKARLNQNSTNSSLAPSRDVFSKPQNLRKPSGKKAGGQKGHKGNGFKLIHPPGVIVHHYPHYPVQCVDCVHADGCMELSQVSDRRYEVDIEIKTITTEHQTLRVQCPLTDELLTGDFPAGINSTVQYGVNLESLAISLNTIGMVSINRTHDILSGVFNVSLSTGTIATMVKNCAHVLSKPVSDIKNNILGEFLVHFDETGTRVNEKTHWAHVASTKDLTYISIEEKRGKKGMDESGILPNYVGTGIHDCWFSYFKYGKIRHSLCCAHLMRELTAVTENTQQMWAQQLTDLLLEMKNTKDELIAQGLEEAPELVWREYSRTYDEILEEAQAQNPVPEKDPNKKGRLKRGKVGALIDRLVLRKGQWLLFFTDFNVPFTNNQAERDIRPFKVKQKVAGCFRTVDGAKEFATIMSFVSTAQKRGKSAFLAIKDALVNQPFPVSLALATE
jgi:transposase